MPRRRNPAAPRTYRVQRVVGKLEKTPGPNKPGGVVTGPAMLVEETLADYLEDRPTESFLILYLDVRNRLIGFTEYNAGSVSGVEVHPSGALRDGLLVGAAAFLTVHNHPTGVPQPSEEDVLLWERLTEAGKLIGLPAIDHLIIGEDGRYYSHGERSTGRVSSVRRAASR